MQIWSRVKKASFKNCSNNRNGKISYFHRCHKNCLNNWHRVHSGKGNYLIQLMNQNCSEYGNWNKSIKNTLEKHEFGYVWIGKQIGIDHFSVDLPKIIMRLNHILLGEGSKYAPSCSFSTILKRLKLKLSDKPTPLRHIFQVKPVRYSLSCCHGNKITKGTLQDLAPKKSEK